MFETGIRQVRMAISMVWGRPVNPGNVERLIEDALETLAAFGAPGDDVQQLLDGPFADPEARVDFQTRALRRTAKRLARVSPFYGEMFARSGTRPDRLTPDDMPQLPVTLKRDLIDRQPDFLARDSRPYLSTRTTGTTGQPAEVWLSRYEIELWPAVAALSGLLRGEIGPDDCMQVNISSRATAAVQQNLTVCRLVGARSRMLGVVPVAESLDSLLRGGPDAPTLLATYPSYLAQLVVAARRRGLGPDDFRLRRIDCGGEVLSSALSAAATETFGPKLVNDTFGMTEVLPVSGRVCEQGHLHHDLNTGFVEVIDLDTGEPAAPGELGTVVITPYYPYRECMPVFRYDTRDLVRRLPDEPLTCDLAGVPGTSRILGKADHLLRIGARVVTVRDLVEVVEGLPAHPWPARFGAHLDGEQLRLHVSKSDLEGASPAEVRRRFAGRGLADLDVTCVADDRQGVRLRPLRADLVETTFAGRN
jgi:phenylacetate-coenzyme A ligase PaaK-like adenylate-forming protein